MKVTSLLTVTLTDPNVNLMGNKGRKRGQLSLEELSFLQLNISGQDFLRDISPAPDSNLIRGGNPA